MKDGGRKESCFRPRRPFQAFYRVSATEGQGVSSGALSLWLLSSEQRGQITVMDIYRSKYMVSKQWVATKPKTESSLKLTAVERWKNGELAEGRKRRLLSLSVLCSALSVQTCRWRRGGLGRNGGREGGQLYLAGEASCAWASWRRAGDGIHNPTCCLHKTPFATKHTHTHPLAPVLLSISCL